jgi:restriction system protein
MGSILMPASAFRRCLSDDAGARSGFALTEADLLSALGAKHPMSGQLGLEDVLRIRAEAYADTVGDSVAFSRH